MGTLFSNKPPALISFSNLVEGATINYRIVSSDGSDTGWKIYSGELIILVRLNRTHLITAYAEKSGYIKSVETTLSV